MEINTLFPTWCTLSQPLLHILPQHPIGHMLTQGLSPACGVAGGKKKHLIIHARIHFSSRCNALYLQDSHR